MGSNKTAIKPINIEFKASDGITAAVAREFKVGGIGRDLRSACKEVADALITNSKIVLSKLARKEELHSEQEKLIKERAGEFVSNQGRIAEYFDCHEVE